MHVFRQSFVCSFLASALILVAASRTLPAQSPPLQPQAPSLLQQLSDDTQRVYERVRGSLVRVQLPTPQWLEQMNEQEKLLRNWGGQLTPDVRDLIRREQERMRTDAYRRVSSEMSGPTTQPAPSTSAAATSQAVPAVTDGAGAERGLEFPRTSGPGRLVLVATGLLVDTHGHTVVPLYVDRATAGAGPLRVLMGDGSLTSGRFVGSDPKTHLTVLQLDNHAGRPAVLAPRRPDDGVLTVVIAPEGGARLVVWTNLHPEPGLVVMPDGSVAGFSFNGAFLGAAACKPIVDQIIATGEVRRAVLGVKVREIGKDDPVRQHLLALGAKPALRVEEVDGESAAQRGGLRVGDLILAIAGQAVGDAPTFAAVIATRSGATELQVLREADVVNLNVDLEPR